MIASLLFNRQLTTNTLLKLSAELGGRAATFLLLLLAALPVYINYSLTHFLIARGRQKILAGLTAV